MSGGRPKVNYGPKGVALFRGLSDSPLQHKSGETETNPDHVGNESYYSLLLLGTYD